MNKMKIENGCYICGNEEAVREILNQDNLILVSCPNCIEYKGDIIELEDLKNDKERYSKADMDELSKLLRAYNEKKPNEVMMVMFQGVKTLIRELKKIT